MASRSSALFAANFEKSWLNAVWITPSAPAAPLRRLSRSSSDPRWTFAPAPSSAAAPASDRESPITSCSAASRFWTTANPTHPVAPVTNTRMTIPFEP